MDFKFDFSDIKPVQKVPRSTATKISTKGTKRRKKSPKDAVFSPPAYQQKRQDGIQLPLPDYDLEALKDANLEGSLDSGPTTNIPVTALCSSIERDYIRAACYIDGNVSTWEWARGILVKAAVEVVNTEVERLKEKETDASSND